MNQAYGWRQVVLTLILVLMGLSAPFVWAQTLGTAPQFNTAVQGQTGAQPEGAFFNFVNWIGNVVAPVGAGGAVFGSIVAFMSGSAYGPMADRGGRTTRGFWIDPASRVLGVTGNRRSFVIGRRSACRLHKS
jgi:hypothetical protein